MDNGVLGGDEVIHQYRLQLFLLVDGIFIISSLLVSNALLMSGNNNLWGEVFIITALSLLLSYYFFVFLYKLYKKAIEYASIGEIILILKIVTLAILFTAMVQQILYQAITIQFLVITWMCLILSIGGLRLCWRMLKEAYFNKLDNKKRTLIIGAGAAGTMVVRQLLHNKDSELQPICFLDDDKLKQNLHILGIPVIGQIQQLEEVVKKYRIEHIIISIPSLKRKQLNKIFNLCAKTKTKTQILPMLEHIITGKVSINQFQDIKAEDLLGRETVELNIESISDYVTNKVVLVTGAGGSIGSEICRQICRFSPSKLILLGHGENSIHSIEMELRDKFGSTNIQIIPEIADIQNKQKMDLIVKKYAPSVIYHAAAHKHVPLMERHPQEAVNNNIIGTKNIAEAAHKYKVETFVFISTDKAVNPTSVMGATKRLAEMVIQHMDQMSKTTKFLAVRFGNVLGSRGSVIPIFQKQIEKGGPVTVTHPEMERYFMTIPEAARLVIQAGSLAKGGEVFVLDMGEPVKIVDLARNLIKLSGYSLEDIEIKYTGIRPGEKLYEELLSEDEIYEEQIYPNIYVGKASNIYMKEIEELLLQSNNLESHTLSQALIHLANRKDVVEKVLYMHG